MARAEQGAAREGRNLRPGIYRGELRELRLRLMAAKCATIFEKLR